MNPNNSAPLSTPKFGTPIPVPIRLSTLKLPEGMAKFGAPQCVKRLSLEGRNAFAEVISEGSSATTDEATDVGLSVKVNSITPDTAVEFDRAAHYKKPVRQAPSVSLEGDGYLRLEDVLTVYPVSRSAWYEGIKQSIYPPPVLLGRRSVGWSRAAIRALVESPPKF